MTYDEFLTRIIDDGIEAAKADYTRSEHMHQLRGSIEGFEGCRGKSPTELVTLLIDSRRRASDAYAYEVPEGEYWEFNCFALEVEWVVNCVSAILVNQGRQALTSFMPTARAVMKAADVVGIAPMEAVNERVQASEDQ